MITLKQPSLVLNSFGVASHYLFSMWRTWLMPEHAACREVVYWIQYACDHSPELELKHVVIHAHGGAGEILISESDSINSVNVNLFSQLRAKDIGTIWIHSCEVAKGGIGKSFCGKLARAAGCDVVAADTDQSDWWPPFGDLFMPSGCIDDFEGNVYRWSGAGNMEVFSPNGKAF